MWEDGEDEDEDEDEDDDDDDDDDNDFLKSPNSLLKMASKCFIKISKDLASIKYQCPNPNSLAPLVPNFLDP